MKYKLLFFLLTLMGLNSCVEYVDYGIQPEPTQYADFKTSLKETSAKYVGDEFEFIAKWNNVDVTSSTDFKVNGNTITSNTYVPNTAAEYTVTAMFELPGLGTKTAKFKFTVLEKDQNPEQGNRIEYNGKSYPISTTIWVLDGTVDQNGKIETSAVEINGIKYTTWIMISSDNKDPKLAKNTHGMLVYVPTNEENITFPYEASSPLMVVDGEILVNGMATFEIENSTYTFAAGGNTAPDLKTAPPTGTADYTNTSLGNNSGESTKLFWKGDYIFSVQKLPKTKCSFKSYNAFETNQVSLDQIKSIKLIK